MGDVRRGDETWIDERADRCEQAWRAGERPRIGDFLGDAEGPMRDRLIEELVRVERQLRAESRETPRDAEVRRPSPAGDGTVAGTAPGADPARPGPGVDAD